MLLLYTPSVIYKKKIPGVVIDMVSGVGIKGFGGDMYTEPEGDCASVPTSYLTHTAMTIMVWLDFFIASLLPFIGMLTSNVIIIKCLVDASINVRSISKYYH